MLLSDAYDILSESVSTCLQTTSASLTKRALHRHLIASLGEHLECKTVEQSVGTILYRRGGDTPKALSEALANQCHTKLTRTHVHTCKPTCAADATTPTCTVDPNKPTNQATEDWLFSVGDMVNNKVHSRTKHNHSTYPRLMLRLITRTREERK